ncbi:MAG: phosphoadenosine phosphosulfate reductase domain-containing protein [Promethearchaeota archaeon]
MAKKTRPPYLGKVRLFWCDNCNLPLFIQSKCHRCHQTPRKVLLSPPGDVRPAFYHDYELLRSTVNQDYGWSTLSFSTINVGESMFPAENIVLLNRIGGLDKTEEVIVAGHVIGQFGYNPLSKKYYFHPRFIGGQLLSSLLLDLWLPDLKEKNFKEFLPPKSIWLNEDGELFFSKGKSILAPGISRFSLDIEKDDYILVYSEQTGKYLGVAISKVASSEISHMLEIGRGNIAKNRFYRSRSSNISSSELNLSNYPSHHLKHFSSSEKPLDLDSSTTFFQTNASEINELIQFLAQNSLFSLPFDNLSSFSLLSSINSSEFGEIIPNPWVQPTHSKWWQPISRSSSRAESDPHVLLHQRILLNLFHVYAANLPFIRSEIEKSLNFIRKTKTKIKKSAAVAYSGGKDSLAVLLLVYRALGPTFKIFFANTGLELPEVEQNVQQVSQVLHMEDKLMVRNAGRIFWELLPTFGPPGRDYRYCCHSLKAQQIMELINELYNEDKVLSFLGQRQYESLNRAQSKKIYVNSFIPLQISATPIKSWISLLLWVFLICEPFFQYSSLSKFHSSAHSSSLQSPIINTSSQSSESPLVKSSVPSLDQSLDHFLSKYLIEIPITPLYFKGHERLGCYLCPASNLATFSLLKETHPQKHEAWFSYLSEYAKKYNLPPEWIDLGLWRYKKLPQQWKNLLKAQQIEYKFQNSSPSHDLNISITKGFSPCLQTGYSVKGRFSQVIDLANLVAFLPALTPTFEYDTELEVISGHGTYKKLTYRFNLFSDGSLFLLSSNRNFDYQAWFRYFFTTIYRSFFCNQCKTCIQVCPSQAIILTETQVAIQAEKCTACYQCITHCPYFQIGKSIINNTFTSFTTSFGTQRNSKKDSN